MDPAKLPHRSVRPFWLLMAALGCAAAGSGSIYAQAPVITNSDDVSYLNVNTMFDPAEVTPAWNVKAPIPTARAGFSIAAANDGVSDKIYVMGGGMLNTCVLSNVVEAYDPATDSWSTVTPMPDPQRWRPSAIALNNIIYVVGGAADGCTGQPLGIVQAYDPATGQWSTKASMNVARLQVGLGADPVNNRLYAVGGASGYPDFKALAAVEVYDPVADTWTRMPDLNTARGLPSVAVIDGVIYAVAGQDYNEPVRSAERYDSEDGRWICQRSAEPPPLRLNPGSAVLDNKIYIAGGQVVGQLSVPLPDMDVYDPVTDTWTTDPSLPTPRLSPGLAAAGGKLYAISGQAPIGKVGEAFTYQITASNSPTYFDASPLPDNLTIDHVLGIISGTPLSAVPSFTVTLTAANGFGSTSKDVNFYIAPSREVTKSTIVSGTCATAAYSSGDGEPFTFRVLTNNASADARLTAVGFPYDSAIGQVLTIDPGTGLISGIVPPAEDGNAHSYGVQLALTDGTRVSQSYLELTFIPPTADLPVITSSFNAPLVLNQSFTYQITTTKPASIYEYVGLNGVLNGLLPPGIVFNGETGTLSGIYGGPTSPTAGERAKAGADATPSGPPGDEVEHTETIKKEPPPHIQMCAEGPPAGTGTAPLTFLISLHDDEVENLSETTSAGPYYSIFTDDPFTSGIGAGLLRGALPGDFVSYTVPVAGPGTYDLHVGIRSGSNQGKFQLAIDGVNQGGEQDEYSFFPFYPVLDFGLVTFTTGGNHTFTFTVTDKNIFSRDYQLIFDYIDLVPFSETEQLSVTDSSAPYYIVQDSKMSGGAGTLLAAKQVSDYLSCDLEVAVGGTYNLTIGTRNNRNAGIFQLFVDGVAQGYPQDEYSPTRTYGPRDFGTLGLSAGLHNLKFAVTGQNPGSEGYKIALDYLDLVLASRIEAETLNPDATAPVRILNEQTLSGSSGLLLNARNIGKSLSFPVKIPVPGSYDIRVGVKMGDKCGIFKLLIDDVKQGDTQDEYSAVPTYQVLDLGRHTFLNSGNHRFEFVVTNQNPASSGYQFIFDYVDLVR